MQKYVLKEIRKLEGEKRSALGICIEILGIAKNGVGITRVVYNANLNFKIVRVYLERLENAGLIEQELGIIQTTEKGLRVLEYFHRIDRLLEKKQHLLSA